MRDSVTNCFPFMQALMEVENGIRSGYNKDTNTWSPHPSLEGGTETLGYGHKLSQSDINNGTVYIKGLPRALWGVTNSDILDLFHEDVKHAEEVARNEWLKHRPDYGVSWDYLKLKYRCVLTNLVFNLGSLAPNGKLEWPMLFKAIANGDDKEVRKQMVTSYRRPDGLRVKLTARAKRIADSVGLEE